MGHINLVCVEDVSLLSKVQYRTLKKSLESLSDASKEFDLEVNVEKTDYKTYVNITTLLFIFYGWFICLRTYSDQAV
jgi:hypothetical protein